MSYNKIENHAALINQVELKAEHFRVVSFVIAYYRAIAAIVASADKSAEFVATACAKLFKRLNLDDAMLTRLASKLHDASQHAYNDETIKRYRAANAITRTESLYAVIDAYYVLFASVKASNVPYISKNRANRRADNAHMIDLTVHTMFNAAKATKVENVQVVETKAVKTRKRKLTELATIEKSTANAEETQTAMQVVETKEESLTASN